MFFYEGSNSEIKTHFSENPGEAQAQILVLVSLYLQRYNPRYLGFLQALELHPKHVT